MGTLSLNCRIAEYAHQQTELFDTLGKVLIGINSCPYSQ